MKESHRANIKGDYERLFIITKSALKIASEQRKKGMKWS